jgi:hypothetical protein
MPKKKGAKSAPIPELPVDQPIDDKEEVESDQDSAEDGENKRESKGQMVQRHKREKKAGDFN